MSAETNAKVLPVICVEPDGLEAVGLSPAHLGWLKANRFEARAGELLALPDGSGGLAGYAFGLGPRGGRHALVTGLASAALPGGHYRLDGAVNDPLMAELGFRLGAYRYETFKPKTGPVVLAGDSRHEAVHLAEAAFLARDLINMPPNLLGPDRFDAEIRDFAGRNQMQVGAIVGDDLLHENFPMIHAVGRASAEAPRLMDLRWGREDAPKVTLVGKGVTFDTGGLDIKSPTGMSLMKKDMGGAANILGLAQAIISARLNVRLRVLVPVVENAISGSAFRPGDVLVSRAGITVEIGNTDAEGRLILADALALASEEDPALIIDMATLTGAARVALGPDLPPIYTANDGLAADLAAAGLKWGDPVWHMPLWAPYDADLSSKIADVSHISSTGFAGSITAALFLQRFVKTSGDWLHCDIYGWVPAARPGRPQGGADQAMRAAYEVIKQGYA